MDRVTENLSHLVNSLPSLSPIPAEKRINFYLSVVREHFGDEAVADLITTMEYMSRQDLDALILELKLLQPEIN